LKDKLLKITTTILFFSPILALAQFSSQLNEYAPPPPTAASLSIDTILARTSTLGAIISNEITLKRREIIQMY